MRSMTHQWRLRMTMQSLCHGRIALALLCTSALSSFPLTALGDQSSNDYPTSARVEYVQECIVNAGGKLEHMYQCSCVIDEIAKQFTYDEYVEASTFARYATLPGERGGEIRSAVERWRSASRMSSVRHRSIAVCLSGDTVTLARHSICVSKQSGAVV